MKKLINAEVIRELHGKGERTLTCLRTECLVTPEARTVAGELGFQLIEEGNASLTGPKKAAVAVEAVAVASSGVTNENDAVRHAIRQAVLAKMPQMDHNTALIDQLVDKLLKERTQPASMAAPAAKAGLTEQDYSATVISGGIKSVAGPSIKMGLFEGAGVANQVGLVDLINQADGSQIAAGMMAWDNCFFPWTLNYDEVDYIIEGELHIRCGGQTVVAKAGDVLFIPRNSTIEFGTPSHVKFFYVAHPVNWTEV